MRCILLGGDARQSELAAILRRSGIPSVQLCEKPITPIDHRALTDELAQLEGGDLLVLPQPVSERNGHLNIDGVSGGISLKSIFSEIDESVCVCAFVTESGIERKRLILPMKDEEYLAYSALLTAKALILDWFHEESFTLEGKRVLITGFGRTAKAISNELKSLGIKVLIAARSVHQLNEAYMRGFSAVPPESIAGCDFDILINTVPARILSDEYISGLRKDCRLYDIASKPYGFDIDKARSAGLKAERLPALPGRYYPRLCAMKVYELIIKHMREADI